MYSEIKQAIIKATKLDEITEIRAKLEAIAKYRKHNYEDVFKATVLGIEAALKHIEIYDNHPDKRPASIHATDYSLQQISLLFCLF